MWSISTESAWNSVPATEYVTKHSELYNALIDGAIIEIDDPIIICNIRARLYNNRSNLRVSQRKSGPNSWLVRLIEKQKGN